MSNDLLFMKKLSTHQLSVEMDMTYISKELIRRGCRHDMSERSGLEKAVFSQYADGYVDMWGIDPKAHPTPTDLLAAIATHAKNNDYRPEHHPQGVKDMDIIQLTEMVCDITSAAKELMMPENQRQTVIRDMLSSKYNIEEPMSSVIINSVNNLIDRGCKGDVSGGTGK